MRHFFRALCPANIHSVNPLDGHVWLPPEFKFPSSVFPLCKSVFSCWKTLLFICINSDYKRLCTKMWLTIMSVQLQGCYIDLNHWVLRKINITWTSNIGSRVMFSDQQGHIYLLWCLIIHSSGEINLTQCSNYLKQKKTPHTQAWGNFLLPWLVDTGSERVGKAVVN